MRSDRPCLQIRSRLRSRIFSWEEEHMKRRCLPALSLVVVASLALTTAPRAQQRDDFQLVETTIAELQAQYAERNLTPEDVVEMYLARIHRFDQSAGQPLN